MLDKTVLALDFPTRQSLAVWFRQIVFSYTLVLGAIVDMVPPDLRSEDGTLVNLVSLSTTASFAHTSPKLRTLGNVDARPYEALLEVGVGINLSVRTGHTGGR